MTVCTIAQSGSIVFRSTLDILKSSQRRWKVWNYEGGINNRMLFDGTYFASKSDKNLGWGNCPSSFPLVLFSSAGPAVSSQNYKNQTLKYNVLNQILHLAINKYLVKVNYFFLLSSKKQNWTKFIHDDITPTTLPQTNSLLQGVS